MSDSSIALAVKAADLKSVELLLDYTKFHIGVYLTMASAFITVASLKSGNGFALTLRKWPVRFAMFFFFVAGVAGGVIVSSITQCYGHPESTIPDRCASTSALLAQSLGPWETKIFTGLQWTQIEHTSFWIGLLFALAAFRKSTQSPETPREPQLVRVEGSIEVRRPRSAA